MQRKLLTALVKWQTKPNRKPLLLKGVRQVGKTYLLKQFGEDNFPNYYYINFESDLHLHKIFEKNLDPKRILTELSFNFGKDINIEQDFLIFDEIQACPAALTSLKYFHENCPKLALAAAGSLLGVHLHSHSFPVGKVDMLKLHPMNFTEWLEAHQQDQLIHLLKQHDYNTALPELAHQQLWQLWKLYITIGGMPEVVKTFLNKQNNPIAALQEVRIKQHEIIVAYNSDIAKHAGKVNAMHIARVWRSAAIQLASTQNDMADRFRFKDVIPGIDRYQRLAGAIDWLDAADLIIKVPIAYTIEQPLKAYAKESLFKLLYSDVGLLGARCEISPETIMQDNYGGYKGYIAENFVAQALYSNDLHDMNTIFSWQEHRAEIEFLQTTDSGIIPIEVKAGTNTRAKSLEKLINKYHPNYSVILSANNISHDNDNKIYKFPLYLASLQPWLMI